MKLAGGENLVISCREIKKFLLLWRGAMSSLTLGWREIKSCLKDTPYQLCYLQMTVNGRGPRSQFVVKGFIITMSALVKVTVIENAPAVNIFQGVLMGSPNGFRLVLT
jgi:hypothetical protein